MLGKRFPQEYELRTKHARLNELNTELNIDERRPMEKAMDDSEPPKQESILAKINKKPPARETVQPKKNITETRD